MRDLTQGSVTWHVLHLAVFMAVSMVFQTLYYLVDLYFVSRLGKEAIAGVGLAGNWMLIVLALTQMLGVGTTVLISHAAGRKDQPRAQMVFNQSFVLALLVGTARGGAGLRVPRCRIAAGWARIRKPCGTALPICSGSFRRWDCSSR